MAGGAYGLVVVRVEEQRAVTLVGYAMVDRCGLDPLAPCFAAFAPLLLLELNLLGSTPFGGEVELAPLKSLRAASLYAFHGLGHGKDPRTHMVLRA